MKYIIVVETDSGSFTPFSLQYYTSVTAARTAAVEAARVNAGKKVVVFESKVAALGPVSVAEVAV
jgi:hypothetical protein